MKSTQTFALATLASAVALAATVADAQTNVPKPTYKFEKCYGIVKAGKNDCFSARHSCGGTSVKDNEPDAWIYVPAGACGKITGASTGTEKK
jgi:uncharacterized membrane protein